MTQKRILLINEAFYPDESGSAQYLFDLARELKKSGASVWVLTSSHGYLEQKSRFRPREVIEEIKIVRIPPSPFQGRSKAAKILKALWVNFFFAIKMLLLGKFDSAVVLTSPPLVAFITTIFLRKSSLIYWTLDVNPDQSVAAGWIKRNGIVHRVLDFVHKIVLKRANLIITLDEYMRRLIVSKGASSEKVVVRNLWPIIDIDSSKSSVIQSGIEANGPFIVMYSGNLGICSPLNALIGAAKILKSDDSVEIIISGSGSQEEKLKSEVLNSDLNNIRFLPYSKRGELESKLNASDLHIISMADEYCGMIHPSKIYSVLALGKPFIFLGPKESFINDELVNKGLGERVHVSDAKGLASAIKSEQSKSKEVKGSLSKQRNSLAYSYGSAAILCKDILSIS